MFYPENPELQFKWPSQNFPVYFHLRSCILKEQELGVVDRFNPASIYQTPPHKKCTAYLPLRYTYNYLSQINKECSTCAQSHLYTLIFMIARALFKPCTALHNHNRIAFEEMTS